MAVGPNITPKWEEITFEEESLDARALVTRTDKNSKIIFASKAYRDMTKYSKDELINSPHSIVTHPFMPESAFKDMWDTIQKGELWHGLVMNLRKDGLHYRVDVHVDPIDSAGNVVSEAEKIAGYATMRKAELLEKSNLKDWKVELLEKLKSENLLKTMLEAIKNK